MKQNLLKYSSVFLSLILLLSAFAHLFYPEYYAELIPDFVSAGFANVAAAIAEGIIGIALLVGRYRSLGGLAFAILMLLFLPIHIWDALRENSALGASPIPEFRLIMQLGLIYLGWWIYKRA